MTKGFFNMVSMEKLLFFALLFPLTVFTQKADLDSLDRFIQKQVTDFKVPGLSIGIIKDGQVLFKKGYGVNSTTDHTPISTQTVFPIMSCTKAFTATAIGILVDRGKLKWKDKVIKYLPHFKLSDPYITRELTISDILTHRSGLETFEGDLLWYGTDYSREEVVRRIQYSPLRAKYRSQFAYQNVMYLVAGLIIEKVSGVSWDEFIRKEILVPLSMKKTSTSIAALTKEGAYAHPHIQGTPIPLVSMDNIAPAGAINATIDDLLQWLPVWMNGGKPILSTATYEAITSEKIKVSKGSKEGYGYGWFVETTSGMKVLSHGGGMPGYKSFVMILPKKRLGVVVLANTISYLNEQVAGIITDYLLGKKITWQEVDKLYGANFRFSWDEQQDTSHAVITPDWARYTGVYTDAAYGDASIEVKEGRAFLTLLPAKELLSGPLYYVDENKLRIVFKDPFIPTGEVVFYKEKDGKVKSFKLNIASDDFHFKYLHFIKQE